MCRCPRVVGVHFRVLVVEGEPETRKRMHRVLASEGLEVISAGSVAQARAVIDEPFEAVLLSRRMPDGDGAELAEELLERLPCSRVVVTSPSCPIPGLPSVSTDDLGSLSDFLGLGDFEAAHEAARQARRSLGVVHREWIDLCKWDPSVPPAVRPPVAESVIRAVTEALERPQPLGWGLDPALQPIAEVFGLNVGDVHASLAMLICLREAFTRVVIDQLRENRLDALCRLQMILERTMVAVADAGVRRLGEQALTDELTGLANRWAFEQDLKKELRRISRNGGPLTLVLLDVDGLKLVNDTMGHPQGDQTLRNLAHALGTALRSSDHAYRIGGDEFAVLLHDAGRVDVDELERRLRASGSPAVSIGIASVPEDDPASLVELADARLYTRRRHRRAM